MGQTFAGVGEQRAAVAAVGRLRYTTRPSRPAAIRARAGRAIVFFGHVPPSHTCSGQSLAKPLARRRRSDHHALSFRERPESTATRAPVSFRNAQTLRVNRKRRVVSTRENGRYEPYRHLNSKARFTSPTRTHFRSAIAIVPRHIVEVRAAIRSQDVHAHTPEAGTCCKPCRRSRARPSSVAEQPKGFRRFSPRPTSSPSVRYGDVFTRSASSPFRKTVFIYFFIYRRIRVQRSSTRFLFRQNRQ